MELVYVPDPGVIIQWALPGEEPREAERALDLLQLWLEGGCEFLLPPLWSAEVGALLARHHPERAGDLLELLLGYRIPEARMTAELGREALRLCREYGVGYYQALYHAVALQQGALLVTADAAYCRKAKGAGRLLPLKEFGPR